MAPYSPERRTAVVLCGTGAHGAYHAGVLRALQEAGVKIDLLAGQGIGAGAAALAAIDGAARLWDENGIWRDPGIRRFYAWRWPIPVALALLAIAAMLLAAPVGWAAFGLPIPVWLSILALSAVSAGVAVLAAGVALAERRTPSRRRAVDKWWWRLFGAPLDAEAARSRFAGAIWDLIRGVAPIAQPSRAVLGRRYAEMLAENLGHPGFRELLLVATDLDARRDVVAAYLNEPHRAEFLAPRAGRDRRSEVLDLAGVGRDYAMDVVAAALTPPMLCDPHPVSFGTDTFWRGETHRMCDRAGAVNRLLEEVAAAGATQAVVVTAAAPVTTPHRLRAARLDLRSRLGEYHEAAEAAALRDALEMARLRFDSIYVITPSHNPIGPFDFDGAYDEASDRQQDLGEMMERAYEDAYRQFIEPVVGASGDHLARPDLKTVADAAVDTAEFQ